MLAITFIHFVLFQFSLARLGKKLPLTWMQYCIFWLNIFLSNSLKTIYFLYQKQYLHYISFDLTIIWENYKLLFLYNLLIYKCFILLYTNHILVRAPQSLLSSLDQVQNHLYSLVGVKFPLCSFFTHRYNVIILSLFPWQMFWWALFFF